MNSSFKDSFNCAWLGKYYRKSTDLDKRLIISNWDSLYDKVFTTMNIVPYIWDRNWSWYCSRHVEKQFSFIIVVFVLFYYIPWILPYPICEPLKYCKQQTPHIPDILPQHKNIHNDIFQWIWNEKKLTEFKFILLKLCHWSISWWKQNWNVGQTGWKSLVVSMYYVTW